MGPFVTISGATVDATLVIDALVGKIAELCLENASLRAQVSTWSVLAQTQSEEMPTNAPRASESPTGATEDQPASSRWPRETPPDGWDGAPPSEMPRSGGYVPVSGP